MTGLDVTFSGGIVETPRDGVDLTVLYGRLDEAVARAKAEGKARIVFWNDSGNSSEAE